MIQLGLVCRGQTCLYEAEGCKDELLAGWREVRQGCLDVASEAIKFLSLVDNKVNFKTRENFSICTLEDAL